MLLNSTAWIVNKLNAKDSYVFIYFSLEKYWAAGHECILRDINAEIIWLAFRKFDIYKRWQFKLQLPWQIHGSFCCWKAVWQHLQMSVYVYVCVCVLKSIVFDFKCAQVDAHQWTKYWCDMHRRTHVKSTHSLQQIRIYPNTSKHNANIEMRKFLSLDCSNFICFALLCCESAIIITIDT